MRRGVVLAGVLAVMATGCGEEVPAAPPTGYFEGAAGALGAAVDLRADDPVLRAARALVGEEHPLAIVAVVNRGEAPLGAPQVWVTGRDGRRARAAPLTELLAGRTGAPVRRVRVRVAGEAGRLAPGAAATLHLALPGWARPGAVATVRVSAAGTAPLTLFSRDG